MRRRGRKFLSYHPDLPYLLPPSVKDVLRDDHWYFFVHRVVGELDLSALEANDVEEGRAGYALAAGIVGTGDRGAERATRDATLSAAGLGKRESRNDPGVHGLQRHADVEEEQQLQSGELKPLYLVGLHTRPESPSEFGLNSS